jgi:translation initiation factor IF-2
MPVQILGLKAAPQVGDVLRISSKELKELKKKVKSHQLVHHMQSVVGRTPLKAKSKDDEDKPEVKKLFVILKTDTLGSAEAILESMKKLVHPEVAVEIVQRGLGIISEADVLRADAGKAEVLGFHVPVSPKSDQLARSKGVVIKNYDVIYDLIDDITASLEELLPPAVEEKELGELKVLAIFRNENTFQVVGGKVTSGTVAMGANVKVMRSGKEITSGKITQLQSNKQNVQQVSTGAECGMKVECKPVIAAGDTLVFSVTTETKRKLGTA